MAASNTWGWLINLLAVILRPLLAAISPLIKELFEDSLNKLLKAARGTPNPIDDYFVEFLFTVLGMPIPPAE
jgi:hypothetical protein